MPSATPHAPSSLTAQSHSKAASGRTSSDSEYSHLRSTTPTSVHSSSSELGDNDIIPPPDPSAPRTLVLCFDGTGDQFDSETSNVIKLFSMLKKDDRREQMVYYQSGIGTYTTPQVTTSVGQFVSKTMDEMVAWNLDAHVMNGYEFLMQNYEAGDKICLFGFSRGAYTARALAGMLHKVGLLPPDNHQQIPFAYKMYTRTDELGWKQSTAFKKAFCIDVSIEFIGVWDTVCSVGIIPHRLPFTASNTAIRTFRHALSLDERRAKFKANIYNRPTEWESKQGTHPGDMPRPVRRSQTKVAMTKFASAAKARLRNVSASTATTAVAATATAPNGAVKNTAVAAALEGKRETVEDDDVKSEAAVAATETSKAVSTSSNQSTFWATARNKFDTLRTLMRKKGKRLTEEEEAFDKADAIQCQSSTDVKEVWFAGCHCDVGGGSVLDETPHALERIPLRWMIRECFRTNSGIRFHGELLKRIGLDPATLWPVPEPSHSWDGNSFVYPGQTTPPGTPTKISLPAPPPRLSVESATPPEKTLSQVGLAERAALSDTTFAPPAAPKPSLLVALHTPMRPGTQQHARNATGSTTHTLLNGIENQMLAGTTEATPLVPSEWGPDPQIDELEEERLDARSKIYDQLTRCRLWWLLEFFPVEQRVQRAKDHKWEKHYRFNLGRGRDVQPTEQFYLHRSVKYRMELKDLEGGPYRPRARWPSCVKPIYVD